jgi:hypothetical protein
MGKRYYLIIIFLYYGKTEKQKQMYVGFLKVDDDPPK